MPARKTTKLVALDHPVNSEILYETRMVTPDEARELLKTNQHNRNLRENVVEKYARDMKAGRWSLTGEAVKVDWYGNLIDGQHRLHAIVEADVPAPLTIIRNLDPETQAVMDAGARRNTADALRWHGVQHNAKEIAACANIAADYDAGKLRSAASSVTARLTKQEAVAWYETAKGLDVAIEVARRHYKAIGATPSALGFVMWKLLAVDEDAALEFITSTAEYRTNGAKDPRSVLIRTLGRVRDSGAKPTSAQQINLFFRAWNAWRQSRAVSSLPLNSSSVKPGKPAPTATPELV